MGMNFYTNTATSTASEVDLFDITVAGSHAFKIFLNNMVAGDKIRIRVYDWDDEGSTYRLQDEMIHENAQTLVSWVTPFVASQRYKVSLQRLAGTDRDYNWCRIEVT
jgi:hypothetical protein